MWIDSGVVCLASACQCTSSQADSLCTLLTRGIAWLLPAVADCVSACPVVPVSPLCLGEAVRGFGLLAPSCSL